MLPVQIFRPLQRLGWCAALPGDSEQSLLNRRVGHIMMVNPNGQPESLRIHFFATAWDKPNLPLWKAMLVRLRMALRGDFSLQTSCGFK